MVAVKWKYFTPWQWTSFSADWFWLSITNQQSATAVKHIFLTILK